MILDAPIGSQLPVDQVDQVLAPFYAVTGRAELPEDVNYNAWLVTPREYVETQAAAILWTLRAFSDMGVFHDSPLPWLLEDPDYLASWDCSLRDRVEVVRALATAPAVGAVGQLVEMARTYLARSAETIPIISAFTVLNEVFEALPGKDGLLQVACTRAMARHAAGLFARSILTETPDALKTGPGSKAQRAARVEAVKVMVWAVKWGARKKSLAEAFGISHVGLNKMLARAEAEE